MWAYLDSRTCRLCGANNVTPSMPCPICQKGNMPEVKPTGVKVRPYTQAKRFTKIQIPSGSREGLNHTLVCDGRRVVSCSCESFFYRKRCRHKTEYEEK